MDQTIVTAVDTRTPDEVVRVAGSLAGQLGANLVLANVQSDPPLLPGSVGDRERARHRRIEEGLETLERAAEVLPDGLSVEYRAELGSVVGRLQRVVDETGALLLVTGSRSRGALASSMLGSVSHELARQASSPVLIVPAPDEDRSLEGASALVVGIDGSGESVAAAAFADELAHALGDELVLVHAYDAPGPIPSDVAEGDGGEARVPPVMRDALRRITPEARYVVEHGPPEYVLPEVAAREQARMIVIGGQEHWGFGPFGPATVTAQLPRATRYPVLVVRGNPAVRPARARRALSV